MASIVEGDEPSDRIVIRLEPRGPVPVDELTSSFSALARLYERHYRHDGEPAPKLYVTKLETGSIIAEVAPYVLLLGQAVPWMDGAMIVSDFITRLSKAIRVFSDPAAAEGPGPLPSAKDAADIREFVRPLAGRKGATLGIKHARYSNRDGSRETVLEYTFDEAEINRATINIDQASEDEVLLAEDMSSQTVGGLLKEVTMIFEQASRRPGKEAGRTADKAIVAEASPKALPVYFRRGFRDLKEKMIRGDINPLTNSVFIVDVHVTRVNGEPKAYIVADVHDVLPMDED